MSRFSDLLVGLFLLTVGAGCSRMQQAKEEISFSLESPPYSADPVEFDAVVHHSAYGSTLSGLVSNYEKGRHTGLIAESWSVSPNQRVWRFKVRSGLTFEDGSPIGPGAVARSLHRIAFLLRKRNSRAGVIEYLEGIEGITPNGRIPGISEDSEGVTLRFTRSMPDLLDQLSFGLYAIVSSKDFNADTLEWRAGLRPTASGPYRIGQWTEEKGALLELRDAYPRELLHSSAFPRVRLFHQIDGNSKSDLFVAGANYPVDGQFDFFPSGLRSIYFIKAISHQEPSSPVHGLEERRWLRQQFLKAYGLAGFEPSRSFFPEYGEVAAGAVSLEKPEFSSSRSVRFSEMQPGRSRRLDALNLAFRKMAEFSGLKAIPVPQDVATLAGGGKPQGKADSSYDLFVMGTQIRIGSPDEDIRFMFRSKEGIRLPDTDGRIEKELSEKDRSKEKLDIPRINQLLWEQAAVWPTLHPVTGYYARRSAGIDLSRLNLAVAPIQFQWIGRL